jgi:hypothetical protein
MDSNLRFPNRSVPVFDTAVRLPCRFDRLATRNRKFESISLQQWVTCEPGILMKIGRFGLVLSVDRSDFVLTSSKSEGERDQKFADSLLKGTGFETTVPRKAGPVRDHLLSPLRRFPLPDRKRLSQRGTDGSNPAPSSGEQTRWSRQISADLQIVRRLMVALALRADPLRMSVYSSNGVFSSSAATPKITRAPALSFSNDDRSEIITESG